MMCVAGNGVTAGKRKKKRHEYDIVAIGLSQMSRTVRRARKDSSVQTWNSELTKFTQGSNTVASRSPEREVEGGAKEEAGPDGGLEPLPPL